MYWFYNTRRFFFFLMPVIKYSTKCSVSLLCLDVSANSVDTSIFLDSYLSNADDCFLIYQKTEKPLSTINVIRLSDWLHVFFFFFF